MTQVTAPSSNPAPLNSIGQIIQWGGECLSDPRITRIMQIMQVTAIPLSIIGTYCITPYLILDPTTTWFGVGCAVLINTIALQYLHTFIKDSWEANWNQAHYRTPDLPENQLAQTLVQTARAPSAAEKNYTDALQALDLATHEVKIAQRRRDGVDQGKEKRVEDLRNSYLNKRKELIECATTKKTQIHELITQANKIQDCKNTATALQDAIEKACGKSDAEIDSDKAKAIVGIMVNEIAQSIPEALSYTLNALNNKLEEGQTPYTENIELVKTNLENYRTELETLNKTLQLQAKREEGLANDLEELKKKHTEKISERDTAKSDLDSKIAKLEAQKQMLLETKINLEKHKKYGLLLPEGTAGDDLTCASAEKLFSLEKELRMSLNKNNEDKEASERLQQVASKREKRDGEVNNLQRTFDQQEEDILISNREVQVAQDQYYTLGIQAEHLLSEITKIEQELNTIKAEKNNHEVQKSLKDRIELLDKACKLIHAKTHLHSIATMESTDATMESIESRILTACETAHTAWQVGKENTSSETSEYNRKLTEAETKKRTKEDELDSAYKALSQEKKEQFKDKINALRGARYMSIVAASQATAAFYSTKISNLSRNIPIPPGNERSAMENLRLKVLKEKIHLAAVRIEDNSNPVNIDRLCLAQHTLQRHRAEQKLKVARGLEKETLRKELIEMIETEQKLIYSYYSKKLSLSNNSIAKCTLKANLAILNLVLDRMYIDLRTKIPTCSVTEPPETFTKKSISTRETEITDLSPLSYQNRKKYNIFQTLKDNLIQTEATEEGTAFSQTAYGKSFQEACPDVLTLAQHNQFIRNILGKLDRDALDADQNNHAALHKLPIFLAEINRQSKDLHGDTTNRAYDEKTHTRALIESKINLIQHSLTKPFVDEPRFAEKYTTDYLPAKKEYKNIKYEEKIAYANALKQSTKEKKQYKTEETRQRTRETRSAAMANVSGIEKLSYAIPTIILGAFYAFSPILTYISLSLRVSQNILWISSATNLFVQGLFPSLLRPEPTPRRTLTL